MNRSQLGISLILLGGFMIASSIVWFGMSTPAAVRSAVLPSSEQVTPERQLPLISPERQEHARVKGSEAAPVTIIEFSDFQCPFCARLHPTLQNLVDLYPETVKWEYRHLPLPNHPEARTVAVAAECVGDLSSNEDFWEFTNAVYAGQYEPGHIDYRIVAAHFGIAETEFSACRSSEKIAERIDQDILVARTLGGNGTPFSVIHYPDGTIKTVAGALSQAYFENLIRL